MKSIRTLILIAIGMVAFTGTAHTTANLEKKQNVVELVSDYTVTVNESVVVDVFQNITLSQTVVAIVADSVNLNYIRKPQTFYAPRTDIGWCRFENTTNNIYKEILQSKKLVSGNQDFKDLFLIQKYS